MSDTEFFKIQNPCGKSFDARAPSNGRYWFFEIDEPPEDDVIDRLEFLTGHDLGDYAVAVQRDDEFISKLPPGYDDGDAAADCIKDGYRVVWLPDYLDIPENAGRARCADKSVPRRLYACRPK